MVNKYPFNIAWSEEDQEYVATCSAFPGLSALGETEEEALAEAKVALGLFIEACEAKSIPLPEPQTVQQRSGQTRLRLPKDLHRQAAEMADNEGVSLNQYIVDAVRSRVAGEQVASNILSEVRQHLAETHTTVASVAMTIQQPVARYTEAISASKEVSIGETYLALTGGEGRKGN